MKMKRILLIPMLLLSALVVVVGCSEDGECYELNDFIENSIPQALIEKAKLPQWLISRVDELEKEAIKSVPMRVYKGKWRKETIYFIFNGLASCMYCDVHKADGTPVTLQSEEEIGDFMANGKWKCIYIIN
ncbi:MAG: hypothetical protein IJ562_04705 [Prevotella sp.]|nr:hypothetical protein [Prevotella sp.]